MEIIAKVSKGSRMDQIYIPKNRVGFAIGNYVIMRPVQGDENKKKPSERPYFYGIKELKPLKLKIINDVMGSVDSLDYGYENVLVTGSFLDEGFNFNDIDILIITEGKANEGAIRMDIERKTGIKAHILVLSNKELAMGLETDPLYQMMLSRCVAKKRFVYKTKHKPDYKLLDLHLLKSKALIANFDLLSGKEKYDLVRNAIAICLYLEKRKASFESVDKEIKASFGVEVQEIKDNMLDKEPFLKKYTKIYDKAFAKILNGIKDGSKQKQAN